MVLFTLGLVITAALFIAMGFVRSTTVTWKINKKQLFALVAVHVGKHVGGDILGQEPVHQQYLFGLQRRQVFGNIHFVEHHQRAAQLAVAVGVEQLVETLLDAIPAHRKSILLVICGRTAGVRMDFTHTKTDIMASMKPAMTYGGFED